MNTNFSFKLIQKILLLILAAGLIPFSAHAQEVYPDLVQLSSTGKERGHAVTFSPDGQSLFVGTSRGIYVLQLSDLQPIRFTPTETWVRALAISPDGSLLASGSYDPVVRLWWAKDGKLVRELRGHTAWVRGLAFSPQGDLLATASDDNTVRLWKLPGGEALGVIEQNTDGARAVAFSPDGALLATGGFDKIIRIWRVSDGSLVRELKGHTDWVRALAFSPDGDWLASGAFDASVRLWRVSDGKSMVTRREHTSSVLGLAFSPDGKLLASASVDTTVRLWKIPQGEPYGLLKGHTDFVFAVAFAPDGQTIASTGVDNTVRIWSVPKEADPTDNEVIRSPTHCQACHHPLGLATRARVIETSCSTCHGKGALSLNWCQASVRPRSPGSTTMQVSSEGTTEGLGVPYLSQDLSVAIATPGNGEHLYAQEDIMATVKVIGQVASDKTPLSEIKIHLEVWSGGQQIGMLSTSPQNNGNFSFLANIRSNESGLRPNDNSFRSHCIECHTQTLTVLPPGEVLLIVSAVAPDGSQASDQRLVYVNRSERVSIPVNVRLDNDQLMPGVNVQASARLYEWRGRDFQEQSNEEGQAVLQVEALSLVPTKYKVTSQPVIVDGILYESVAPVDVVLPAGAISASAINLQMRATQGQISGQLSPLPAEPVDIAAIHLPDGAVSRVVSSTQGAFAYPSLPIGKYQLVADPELLASLNLAAKPQPVDLFKQPQVSLDLNLSALSGASLSGTIRQQDGRLLPFAFISLGEDAAAKSVLPATGSFSQHGLSAEARTLLVSAPGFYSQAYAFDRANEQPLDILLTMHPETRLLEWGSGTILVPSETALTGDGLDLSFERGWLWGQGGAAQPLTIRMGQAEITLPDGKFALESLPGRSSWFYLLDGQATIRWQDDPEIIQVEKEQMVILTEGSEPVPVPYDPLVVAALHPDGDLPFELSWEPTLGSQIRDRLALAGITAAKAITLVTYIMVILSIGVVPLALLYWWKTRRKSS